MVASEIGMEELLPQKGCDENFFNGIATSEKTYCIGTTKINYRKNWTLELVLHCIWS